MPANSYISLPVRDARDDAGYGRLNPSGFHEPRSFEQYPPAPEEDLEAEEEIDAATMDAVLSRVLNYLPGDPYAIAKTDRRAFVDGSTNLSELNTAKGMVPFPSMYKGRTQSGFGGFGAELPFSTSFSSFRSGIEPTGTKKGWSKSPKELPEFEDLEEPEYYLEDILNQDPDEEHFNDVKKLVKLIHWEQGKDL